MSTTATNDVTASATPPSALDVPGALAHKVFHAYVGKATGKAGQQASLDLPVTQMIRFEISETYSISPAAVQTRLKGIAQHGSNDVWVSNDAAKYYVAVTEEVQSLKRDVAIFNSCVATIQSASYLQHMPNGNAIELYRPRRNIMHHMSCDTCGQTGQVTCHTCDRNGKVNCRACHGMGHTTCNSCYGAGVHKRVRDHFVNGVNHQEHYEQSCSACNRTGKLPCWGCFQTGRVNCYSCGGSQVLACGPCGATGWFTDYTRVRMQAIYDINRYLIKDTAIDQDLNTFIEKVGYEGIPLEATALPFRFVTDREKMTVEARRPFETPRTVYTATVHGVRAQIRHFGHAARILDAGGVLDHLIGDDVAVFVESVRGKSGKGVVSDINVLTGAMVALLRTGMAREIIGAAHPGTPDTEAIWNKLHRSVSKETVATILTTLKAALLEVRRVFIIRTAVATIALSAAVPFLLAYLGMCGATPAAFWGVGLAPLYILTGHFMLQRRIDGIVPAASAANRLASAGTESAADQKSATNPLQGYVRSNGLLFTKNVFVSIIACACLFSILMGMDGADRFRQFAIKKRIEIENGTAVRRP